MLSNLVASQGLSECEGAEDESAEHQAGKRTVKAKRHVEGVDGVVELLNGVSVSLGVGVVGDGVLDVRLRQHLSHHHDCDCKTLKK